MSLNIRLKHSATANKKPQPADLTPGELALNINNASPAGYALDDANAVQQMFGKATETQEGQAEIATQGEVNAGADDERIVTPKKLNQRITDYTANTVTPAITVETAARAAAITAEKNARTAADNLRVLKAGDTMTGALVLPADPTKPLEAATKQYVDRRPADGAINVLINGNLKVAQRASVAAGGGRNPLDVATVNVGEYGQDRWKKTAGGMTQIVEDGNYIPNVPYTLSAVGIATPVTANSPASGNWDISTTHGDLPVTARFIQMERGTIATDYELRSIGIEFLLCQRYFESMEVGAGVQGLPASSYFASAYSFAVPKRAIPTVFDRQAILNMGVVNAPISLLEPTLRGGRAQSRVTSTYGGGANCVQYEIISFDCDL